MIFVFNLIDCSADEEVVRAGSGKTMKNIKRLQADCKQRNDGLDLIVYLRSDLIQF